MLKFPTRNEYDNSLAIWTKCRDAVAGQEAVHDKGEIYLPKLSGQSITEYSAYKNRAVFYNASQRTVDALTGLLFHKTPRIEIPDILNDIVKNIDLQGNTLNNFVEKLADELLITGRIGILIDHTVLFDTGTDITLIEAIDNNLRPFIVNYKAEDILSWNYGTYNNVKVLNFVILKEITNSIDENYKIKTDILYRVLEIDKEGFYSHSIYKEVNNQIEFVETIYPLINGKKIKFIPFYIISKTGINIDYIEKPPLLDLININISHYITTADIEHAAHYTALPTPVITGHTMEDGDTLKIGSSEVWVLSESEAKVSLLEYTGQGLGALETRLQIKEQQMATIGSRMLVSEKMTAETAEAHVIKRQSENSALASIAKTIEEAATKALKLLALWLNYDDINSIKYEINKNFIQQSMKSDDITALLQTWLSGGMPFEDFIVALKKGEIIDVNRSIDDLKKAVDKEKEERLEKQKIIENNNNNNNINNSNNSNNTNNNNEE